MLRKAVITLTFLLAAVTFIPNAYCWPVISPLVNTAQIEQISRERFKALQARDDSAFARYYMPDFQMITAWGTVEDLSFLERWIKTVPAGFSLTPSGYRVIVSADGKMAFATFQVAEVYPSSTGGSATDITSQYTEIYVHHRTGWMIIEAHFSYSSQAFGQ